MEQLVTTKDGLKKRTLIFVILSVALIQFGLIAINSLIKVPFFWNLTVLDAFIGFTALSFFLPLYNEKKESKLIKTCIEKNLKLIGAYTQTFKNIYIIPTVKVTDSIIYIDIDNVNIRKILEKNVEAFSSALPENYIINEFFLNKDETEFLIVYESVKAPTRYILENKQEFVKVFESFNSYSLPLDKKRNIDLKEHPHLLITGASGSGKSYYAMFLATYCLFKGFEVVILDFKQSYTLFEDTNASVAYTVEDILKNLRNIREQLHQRQQDMRTYLKQDGNLIACECGYAPLVIFVEEFTALMNSGADKKTLKEIEEIILEVSSIGRTASVHLILITQVASATNLNTSIRSNLTPLVLGNGSSTIYETALGCKVPAISAKLEKGEGLGKFDVDIFKFSTPTLKFPLRWLVYGQE